MRLGRQVVYSIPSFSRPYPFLISSRIYPPPFPKSGDAIQLPTQSPSVPPRRLSCLRNPIPIPLSRCSALIQDDDREMGKFGEIKAKGKIDRNSPSSSLCEFAPRSFAFLLLPRNFLCVCGWSIAGFSPLLHLS